jgi:hypothetical protein
MSDRADKPSMQSQARLGGLQTGPFISDALRAGRRVILVTGRGQVSTRVPEAALAACGGGSARTLHIGPPLPEPPELQEMIGAAVGVVGGRDMSPQAMAQRLRLADPRPNVILAIDDAHTLSLRSLGYLTLMTELLASEAPILQIALAANPSLLDTLAQPEFEGLRSRLSRPLLETIQTLRRADGAHLGLQKPTLGGSTTLLGHVQNGSPAELSRRGHGIARPAIRAAVALLAMSSLAAIGYVAFDTFIDPTLSLILSLNSDAPQRFLTPSNPSQSIAQLGRKQSDDAINPLIDETVDAAASGSVELTSILIKRIAKLESSASPDRQILMLALQDRLAERIGAAVAAGRFDESRRLEQVFRLGYSAIGKLDPLTALNQGPAQSPLTTTPNASDAATSGDPAQQREIAPPLRSPPSGSEHVGAAAGRDRAVLSPNAAAPADLSAAPEQNVNGASPAMLAKAAPPDSPSALSAEQPVAASNGDHLTLSPNAAAPAPPRAASEQNGDEAPPAILAKAEPTTPGDPKARVVTDLPTLAPVRVVLNVARGNVGRGADIQRALVAAGLQIAGLVPVDARRSTPSIGYYFQSDRNSASGVSQLLKPLLGVVDPVALRIRESMPEPGTIEIAIP